MQVFGSAEIQRYSTSKGAKEGGFLAGTGREMEHREERNVNAAPNKSLGALRKSIVSRAANT